MKNNTLLIAGALVVGFLLWSNSAKGGVSFDLDALDDNYGSDNINRLKSLASDLSTKGLSDQQILFLLSQAIHETGLFGDNPNYYSIDTRHNYSGISHGGSITSYASIDDFVNDWLSVLDRGSMPLQASSISDFASRLKQNNYYEDSLSNYSTALNRYYNILTSI